MSNDKSAAAYYNGGIIPKYMTTRIHDAQLDELWAKHAAAEQHLREVKIELADAIAERHRRDAQE